MCKLRKVAVILLAVVLLVGSIPMSKSLPDSETATVSTDVTESTDTTEVDESVPGETDSTQPSIGDEDTGVVTKPNDEGVTESTGIHDDTDATTEVSSTEDTENSDTLDSSSDAESTVTSDPTEPTDTTEPTEDTKPVEKPKSKSEFMDEDEDFIKVGDSVYIYTGEDDIEDRVLSSRSSSSVVDAVKFPISGGVSFTNHVYVASLDGKEVGAGFSSRASSFYYFVLSDGSTAYCIEAQLEGPTGPVNGKPLDESSWQKEKQKGYARALTYGSPNNKDTSDAAKLATAALIWDISCGYRYYDGTYTNVNGSPFYSTPFEKALSRPSSGYESTFAKAKDLYDMYVYRMKIHGKIPSFTASTESGVGDSHTVILKRESNGYSGSLRDTNGVLSMFDLDPGIPGLTVTRSGATLNFFATDEAAKSLKNGRVVGSRRSSSEAMPSDLIVWLKPGTDSDGQKYQEIVSMPVGIDPVPCFYKIKADYSEGIATIKKTSSGDVSGYCFKIYKYGDAVVWYGKSDSSGNVYQTNSKYNTQIGGYEFTGLQDGDYAFKEELSYKGNGKVFPNSWRVRVVNSSGTVTYDKTFTGNQIIKEPNGDAKIGPSDNKVHLTGLSGGGRLIMTINNEGFGNSFSIQKKARGPASVIDQLKGNSCYSLQGAEYEVYKGSEYQETLVTDSNGNAKSSKKYEIGTRLTLKETKAPKGFLKSADTTVTIRSGVNSFTVYDEPTFDPQLLMFRKVDKVTGDFVQGGASFEGAVFRWDYYDNYNWSGTPTRTWYFKTNSLGVHYYSNSYLASNSPSKELYKDGNGDPSLPLGSVKVTEISAPYGYGKIQTLYAKVEQNNEGYAIFEWTPESLEVVKPQDGNYILPEPQDKSTFGSVAISKTGKTTSTSTFEGCEFSVYNRSANPVKIGDNPVAKPGEVCYKFTLNSQGTASSGKVFPVGTYEIRETKGNEYYECNTSWSNKFTISEGSKKFFSFTCNNELISGSISIKKVPADKFTGYPVDHLQGCEFTVYSVKGSQNVEYGKMYVGSDGIARMANIPVGTYEIRETKGNKYYECNRFWVQRFTVSTSSRSFDFVCNNPSVYGFVEISKKDATTGLDTPAPGRTFLGCEFTVYNKSGHVVYVDGKPVNSGDIACVIKVNEKGYGKSPKLSTGMYEIKETAGNNDYNINETWSSSFSVTGGSNNNFSFVCQNTQKKYLGIKIEKNSDTSSLYNFNGCEFTVYNNGNAAVVMRDGTIVEPKGVCSVLTFTDGKSSVSSDAIFPVGTYEVRETKGNDYYHCNTGWSGTFTVDDSLPDSKVFEFSCVNEQILGGVYVLKYDSVNVGPPAGASFTGCEFTVYNNSNRDLMVDGNVVKHGEKCLMMTVSDYGYAESGHVLPVGSYIVRETKGNDYYHCNKDWFEEFTIKPGEENVQVYNTSCTNTRVFGSVTVTKKDSITGDVPMDGASFEGCEFEVYNLSRHPIQLGGPNGKVVYSGSLCFTMRVDKDGKAYSDQILPVGEYGISESKGNDYYECNYKWKEKFKVVNGSNGSNEFFFECVNDVSPAKVSIKKVDTDGKTLADSVFVLEYKNDVGEWVHVTRSETMKIGGCSSPNLSEDGSLRTDATGIIEFTGLYPGVEYRFIEVESPNGYQLLAEPFVVGRVEQNSANKYEFSCKVVDGGVFELPSVGSRSVVGWSVSLCMCMAVTVLSLVYVGKRNKRKEV